MTKHAFGSGWFFESRRHALASHGIKSKGAKADIFTYQFPFDRHKVEEDKVRFNRWGNVEVVGKRFYKDSDGDGVPDKDDCRPFDPKRQHIFTNIRDKDNHKLSPELLSATALRIEKELAEIGYKSDVSVKEGHLELGRVRLNDNYLDKKGYNIGREGRRGRYLGWDNWVEVNNKLNSVFGELDLSANINSQKGEFKVRSGRVAMTEADWNEGGNRNVGSMVSPVSRRDNWSPEGIPRKKGTQFGTLTPEGKVINAQTINLAEVKSDDPLAYAYGLFKGRIGEKMPKERGLAPEFVRGFQKGKAERLWIGADKK